MSVTSFDAYNSVAAVRQRSKLRTVAPGGTSGAAIPVRQDDYETRQGELQRYLVQQRRGNDLDHGRHRAGHQAVHASSSTTLASEPPPFREVDGHLFGRRRYLPKGSSAALGAGGIARGAIPLQRAPTGAKAAIARLLAAIPAKYFWIGLCLLLLNARKLFSLFFSDPSPSGVDTAPTPVDSGYMPT